MGEFQAARWAIRELSRHDRNRHRKATHSPAVPTYILRAHTSFALLPSFSSPATQMAGSQSGASPPSEAKNNARSWIRTKDLFITSEIRVKRSRKGVRGGEIWIEQTYTPKPNGLVLRPENELFPVCHTFFY